MASFSTTRGVPFDPQAAKEIRELTEKEKRKAELRAHGRQLDQEAAERRKQERLQREADRDARRQALREHGRRLDQEAAERRRQIRNEIDAAYAERFSSDQAA